MIPTCMMQASCLVVHDRQTAQAVIAYFQEHRVGLVTCKIVNEMHPDDRYCIPVFL